MYEQFGISKDLEELSKKVEKDLKNQFEEIDRICEINSIKVLNAFQENNLSETHMQSSTGYGIDEPGRNKIEQIYASFRCAAKARRNNAKYFRRTLRHFTNCNRM